MARQANLLIFTVSLETLNDLLNCIKDGYSILPEDLQIFRMGEWQGHLSGYFLIMSSKEFPLIKEGEKLSNGVVDAEGKTLTFKQQ